MQSLLQKYSQQSMNPEQCVQYFVAGETRLTWTSLLYDEFPEAEVYLVGGTVRDILLGRIPNDIDLVIRGIAFEALKNWLMRHGAAEFVGRFGTFKFTPHGQGGQAPIDIALPRKEMKSAFHEGGRRDMEVQFDHRLPMKEDLARRDFTINAMAFELRRSRLIDPFLGLQDLRNGLVNAVLVPETRFQEDATRILRGLRFASQLGFGIEELTWRAICANINLLNKTTTGEGHFQFIVPREAIGKEFLLGFTAHPVHTLTLWQKAKALHLFMPQLIALDEVIEHDGKSALEKTAQLLHVLHKRSLLSHYGLSQPSPSMQVAALMAFLGEDKRQHAYDICVQLHFHQFHSSHEAYVNCKDVFWFVEHLHDFEHVDPAAMRPTIFEKRFLNARGRELLVLMHAYALTCGGNTIIRERIHTARHLMGELQRRIAQESSHEHLPRLVSGSDIQSMGIDPGPHYRELLDKVRDAQWLRKVNSKQEAKDYLGKLITELE